VNVVLAAASTAWVNWDALWKICVIGLIAGAGLPALFAIGLRALSLPAPGTTTTPSADDDRIYFGNTWGAVAATACFAIVLAAIGLGIYWIVSS
jgi:hypothetical protein